MSSYYGYADGYEVKKEELIKQSEKFNELMEFMENNGIEEYQFVEYLRMPDDAELYPTGEMDEDEVKEQLWEKFIAFYKEMKEKTGLEIIPVAPSGNVILSGEDRVYWEIRNAMIPNPDINKDYLSPERHFSFVETD